MAASGSDVGDAHRPRSRSRSPPAFAATTLRTLLPSESQCRWAENSLADRPLDLTDVLKRSQEMAAQMAATRLLNEVFVEMGLPSHDRLANAVAAASKAGILNHMESKDLRGVNRRGNDAKHSF